MMPALQRNRSDKRDINSSAQGIFFLVAIKTEHSDVPYFLYFRENPQAGFIWMTAQPFCNPELKGRKFTR